MPVLPELREERLRHLNRRFRRVSRRVDRATEFRDFWRSARIVVAIAATVGFVAAVLSLRAL
jgi:hypothetical protein